MSKYKVRLMGQTLFGGVAAVVVFSIIVGLLMLTPFATIASLNAVFGLGIPYNLGTFIGVLWLLLVMGNGSTK
jgi:hypothetical protein